MSEEAIQAVADEQQNFLAQIEHVRQQVIGLQHQANVRHERGEMMKRTIGRLERANLALEEANYYYSYDVVNGYTPQTKAARERSYDHDLS